MTLKTLDRSLTLLKYFREKDIEWGVRELAKEANMHHSIVHRTLSTFEKHDFLFKNSNNKYQLGLELWLYGLILEDKLKFKNLIHPSLEKLATKVSETVFLTVLDELEGVTIDIAHGPQSIKFDVTIGTSKPLYTGASNKIIMAYLPEETQLKVIRGGLKKYTEQTVTDHEELLTSLMEIKKQGWSLTDSEYTEDVIGIAVPLFDNQNKIFGSLNVAGPKYRMSKEKNKVILKELQQTKLEVKALLNKLDISFNQLRRII